MDERWANAGRWIALEMYRPETAPLRKIMAVGASAAECARHIAEQGLDPAQYEYQVLPAPY